MSEAAFTVFNDVFTIAVELLYGLCLSWFLRPFLTKRHGAALAFGAYVAAALLCDVTGAPQGCFGLALTALLAALAGRLGAERAMVVLLAVLYWNARTSSGLMVESLCFLAERLLPFRTDTPEAIFVRAVVLVTAFLLSHAAVMAGMLGILRRQLRRQRLPRHWRELGYCCLVPAAGILFGQLISRLLVEFQDGILLQLYERHPAFLRVVPLLALLFYTGAYLTIVLQQRTAALRAEQAAYLVEREQAEAIRARIGEVERFYTRIRQLKHDLRGHLTSLQALAKRGAYDSLDAYIARMGDAMEDAALTLRTGHPVTDVIVGDAERQCRQRGIRFQADFRHPSGCDAFDVGIILQNLLQNALEAGEQVSEDRRSLSLTGRKRGRFFLIEVKNAFSGQVVPGPDGLPLSTKGGDPLLHGIGLGSVRREAEKYMGELEWKAENGEFSATVLLQERSEP